MSAHDQIKAELDAKEPAAAVMLSREVAVEVCREHDLLRAALLSTSSAEQRMREALEKARLDALEEAAKVADREARPSHYGSSNLQATRVARAIRAYAALSTPTDTKDTSNA